jgi:hypothetical protein
MAINQIVNETMEIKVANGTKVSVVWRGRLQTGEVISAKPHVGLVYYDIKLNDGYVCTMHQDHVAVIEEAAAAVPGPVQPELDLSHGIEDNRSDGQFETKPEPKASVETKPLPKAGTSKKEHDR